MSRIERLRATFAYAFAVDSGEPFSDADRALVDRLAQLVVRRRMTAPALMALESARPLSFVGSQVLAFAGPLLKVAFSPNDYDRLQGLLERRHSLDLIIDTIVDSENARGE